MVDDFYQFYAMILKEHFNGSHVYNRGTWYDRPNLVNRFHYSIIYRKVANKVLCKKMCQNWAENYI